MKQIVQIALLTLVFSNLGCTGDGSSSGSLSGNVGAQGLLDMEAISFAPATPEQCSNGGAVYSLYIDQNGNGILDPTETVLTTQKICNGTNGTNGSVGFNTLFNMTRVTIGLSACTSGSGLEISFGLDTNRNGNLDPSEIDQTQILCDGQTGTQGVAGAAGTAGSNGMNAVFQVVPAPADVCANGGSTILLALDAFNTGAYSALDPSQQSVTICNGTNGTNGTNAPPTPYTTVEPIMPCGNTVAYKEVLLRLSNGQVLASFSDNTKGLNTRLAFIPDGSYIDTDDSSCNFQLSTSTDGTTRSISWFGQVQETWSVSP
jgi:hypothetical protein